ncbi:hypothetical protein BMS3Bbin11_00226 [bacterium BMS3Bbin11]|nr:hypothetical protein BMS3Bbin11_00226 [bacterium BMS3Bbin11]
MTGSYKDRYSSCLLLSESWLFNSFSSVRNSSLFLTTIAFSIATDTMPAKICNKFKSLLSKPFPPTLFKPEIPPRKRFFPCSGTRSIFPTFFSQRFFSSSLSSSSIPRHQGFLCFNTHPHTPKFNGSDSPTISSAFLPDAPR